MGSAEETVIWAFVTVFNVDGLRYHALLLQIVSAGVSALTWKKNQENTGPGVFKILGQSICCLLFHFHLGLSESSTACKVFHAACCYALRKFGRKNRKKEYISNLFFSSTPA